MPAPTVRPRVIIVSCGGRKSTTEQPVPAGQMYCGSYHLALRRAADAISSQDQTARVLILSSRYGILNLDDLISPYDLRMGEEGSVTSEQLRQQAGDLGILNAHVTVLGPRAYEEASRTVWPELTAPLAGARGIGEQLAKLADIYTPGRRLSPEPPNAARPAIPGPGIGHVIEEIEHQANARQAREEQRAIRKRAVYATCSQLVIEHPSQAHGSLTFPGNPAKSAARSKAARRYADLYRVQVTGRPDDSRTVDVHGAPRDVARFLSALPRILEGTEARASEAARMYGRWERHSIARPHLSGMSPLQRRAYARNFRAAAFRVVVDILLDLPDAVPEATSGVPPWDQVYSLAGTIAQYYWFDAAGSADQDETARILAAAERRDVTTSAPIPVPTRTASAYTKAAA
ncbi:DUF6884 domain-containing protein [Streptomyces microflavus]|uniref:DUF6884 domain-containing protein n=1 Tax=Streptomyces microflavus TaxID=1919 RepID=UPI00368A4274